MKVAYRSNQDNDALSGIAHPMVLRSFNMNVMFRYWQL